MNILFIIPSLRLAGAERQIVDLAGALAKTEGYCIHLFTFEKDLDLAGALDRTAVKLYNHPRRHTYDFAGTGRIAEIIDREKIDVVHCTLQIALLFGFLGIRRSRGKPKLIDAVHTTINRNVKFDLFDRLLYTRIMRACDRIIAVCDSQREHWAKKYPFLAGKMVTVHNGVDISRFADTLLPDEKAGLRRRLGIGNDELVVGMNAGFRPEKNHEEVFVAFSRLIREGLPVRLLLIGDGDRRRLLEREARKLGIDGRIVWTGFTGDPKGYLSIVDVGVLFSYAETFSMAILEMMAMGRPVVAADIGGTREAVQDGVTGFLVPPRNVDALADGLGLLLRDPRLCRTCGAAARATVLKRFTKDLMAEKTARIFEAVRMQ